MARQPDVHIWIHGCDGWPAAGAARVLLRTAYQDTRKNLLINRETRVICQGFTGRQVSE
mgnify:CR=1 FL=1